AVVAGERRLVDLRLQPLPPPPPPPTPGKIEPPPAAPPSGEQADRWRLQWTQFQRYSPPQKMPWVMGGPLDPYNQNQAKADLPLGSGHTFLNLNLQFNSTFNPGTVSKGDAAGGTSQLVYNQNAVAGVELFGGDTAFEPKR